jgi:hypothetical protein
MEERFQLIERKLVDVDDMLEKIAGQLSGDGSELAPGVIGILLSHTDVIAGHKTRIDRLERTIDRFRWTLAGASGLGGIIGGGAVAIFAQIQGSGL